jgi:hypothetical protein
MPNQSLKRCICILAVSTSLPAALALAACGEGGDGNSAAATAATSAASASAPPAAIPPVPTTTIDYGYLGPLTDGNPDPEVDGKITSRTPERNLALYRDWLRSPPQSLPGDADGPMDHQSILTVDEVQRARFYNVATNAPQLLTPDDWKGVRGYEADLIADQCDSQDNDSSVAPKDRVPADVCHQARAIADPGASQ